MKKQFSIRLEERQIKALQKLKKKSKKDVSKMIREQIDILLEKAS